MQNPTVTVDEMNKKYDSLTRAIDQIQTTVQQELADGPATAQAARLVALGLSKQACTMLESVGSSLQCLQGPSPGSSTEEDNPLKELVSIAREVVEEFQEQFDVQKEAIAPYLYETTALMLPVIESLVDKAQEKLREADELTQQVRSLAW